LARSQAAIIDGYAYLFGGITSLNILTNVVFSAPLANITNWSFYGSLPYPANSGQFFEIGDKGYLITTGIVPGSPRSQGTRILSCNLSNPGQWIDTGYTIPGEVSKSQIAIIDDRIFLFGGSGSSLIFVNDYILKYYFTSSTVIAYGETTRTLFNNASPMNLFQTLGFPWWKTDY